MASSSFRQITNYRRQTGLNPVARPVRQTSEDATALAFRLQQEGKYLASADTLEKALISSPPNGGNTVNQELATALSFVGEYGLAVEIFDGPPSPGEDTAVPAD